jgi:hypothetical protein
VDIDRNALAGQNAVFSGDAQTGDPGALRACGCGGVIPRILSSFIARPDAMPPVKYSDPSERNSELGKKKRNEQFPEIFFVPPAILQIARSHQQSSYILKDMKYTIQFLGN